jgi:protease I
MVSLSGTGVGRAISSARACKAQEARGRRAAGCAIRRPQAGIPRWHGACKGSAPSREPAMNRILLSSAIAVVAVIACAFALGGCHDGDGPRATAHQGRNDGPLAGRRVAILATEGFERSELLKPRAALDEAGAATVVVSPKSGSIRSWDTSDWGDAVSVDVALGAAKASDYDALLLPGGVINPDKLRLDPQAIAFVRAFVDAGKPIAAICHGPWTLVDAGGAKGRKMTSWPSLRADLINAGATWMDQPVVQDGVLVTSRKPDDIPQFNAAMISAFGGAPKQASTR